MHRLEDMRIIENNWTVTSFISQVDENGQMTTVDRAVAVDNAIHETWPSTISAQYRCDACCQMFSSWEEAKLHITDLDQ